MWKPLGAVRGILCAMPPASPPAPTHAPRDWAGAPSSDADPQAGPAGGATAMRLDKWLWAARWFKTRSLAADAVSLGRVRVNGQAVKPARDLRPGDRVTLHGPMGVRTVDVRARGYHGTRMDDVADVVGLNKATVYHYYASKSLILFDIYRRAAENTLAAVDDDPAWTAREALYQYTARLLANIAGNPDAAAVYFQEQPYITEWFTDEQVAEVREKETQVYEHVAGLIDRGIASGEFFDCDSHVVALGYIGMTMGAYRWLRPDGRRTATEIAAEFSTALLRGLIRDEKIRTDSPLGDAQAAATRKAHV